MEVDKWGVGRYMVLLELWELLGGLNLGEVVRGLKGIWWI
jgi:hypothetical protein